MLQYFSTAGSTVSAPEGTTIRSTSGIVSSIAALIVGGFLIADLAIRGTWEQTLKYAPWVLLLVFAIYVLVGSSWIKPTASSLQARNMFRRHTIGWQDVTDISVHYQVVVKTKDGKSTVLIAGPAAGRPGRLAGAKGEGQRTPPILLVRDDLTSTWDLHRNTCTTPTTRSWDVPLVATAVVLIGLTIAAALS